MRRLARFLAFALLMSLWAALRAETTNYRLAIEAPAELVEALRTQTLLGRWRADPAFEPDQLPLFLERAREEAEAIAQAAGFFAARASVVATPDPAGVPVIRIAIDAGARVTVARLRLEVRGVDDELVRTLAEAWPLPEGGFFRTGEWEAGKRQLIEQLQQRGHLRARIAQSAAEVDADATSAALTVSVDAGPRLAFGPLAIRGLARYPRSIVEEIGRAHV